MSKRRHLKTPMMRFLEAVDPQQRSIQQIMLDAFRHTGTELAAARLMGVTQQSYNSWKYRLNLAEAAYNIHLEKIAAVFERFKHLTEDDAIPDPVNAEGLILAFEYYSQGGISDRDVGNLLNALGYRPSRHTGKRHRRLFGPDTIRDMLQNRFYLGETQYKGEIFPGRHPALISEELFAKCQQVR